MISPDIRYQEINSPGGIPYKLAKHRGGPLFLQDINGGVRRVTTEKAKEVIITNRYPQRDIRITYRGEAIHAENERNRLFQWEGRRKHA